MNEGRYRLEGDIINIPHNDAWDTYLKNLLLNAIIEGANRLGNYNWHDVIFVTDLFFSQIWIRAQAELKKDARWKKEIMEDKKNICSIWWIPTDATSFEML